ncbi:chromosome segregation protein SMC [Algihabitans albus]|uniref:chromosome segregation protein SMC n=1 Tax=Algihabitans albus TaxID=2164067 RepID=UPI000E5D9647|nr:chromosome segregation protein SMC [Algihabitans albus]
MVQFVKLRLTGFKSFVDPTEFMIERGTTGVVGPNGCGKSNLVEALRWVMGETSAKRMRGGEMDDVIFGGSASRPSRNLAEVMLHLDNAGRDAPPGFNDYEEIEIGRRIEREKGSDYRVNGKSVRAKDVQLFFADLATGAGSTALVSQGRIGAIVNAKPTDRRHLLEEAAGISGLHARRHEAELRLRAAETNLERLDDVIGTLDSQLGGLKRQARQATRYRNIAEQLRRTEALLLHLDAEAARNALRTARERLATAEAQVAGLTEQSARAATLQAEAASALPPLREVAAETSAALQRLLLEREGLEREEQRVAETIRQAEQRLAQLATDLERSLGQSGDAAEALEKLTAEQGELTGAAEGEGEAREAAEGERDNRAAIAQETEEALSQLSAQVAADEAKTAALERRVGELNERIQRLTDRLSALTRDRERLETERTATNDLEAADATLAEAEAALERARSEAEQAETALTEARSGEAEGRQALQVEEAAKQKIDAEIAALSAVLNPGEADMWPPVVEALTVEPGFETALGAALGDDLLQPTDEAAPVHWETLPALTQPPPLPESVRSLADAVQGAPALARRLSQVGIVTDAAQGARLQSQLAPGQRLVSREGALWRWDGLTAKADAPTAAAVRLAQKNRLADLQEERRDQDRRVEAAQERFAELRAAAEASAQSERATREAQRAAYAEANRARDTRSQLAAKLSATDSKLSALEESRQRLEADLAEARDAKAETETDRAALPDLTAARTKVGELRAALTEKRSALSEAEAQLQTLLRESQQRANRLQSIGREMEAWRRRAEEADGHARELQDRRGKIEAELEDLKAQPLELAASRESLAEAVAQAETARKQAADGLAVGESQLGEADRVLKQAEQALAAAREERVRAEGAVEQGQQGVTNISTRAQERLEAQLDQLLDLAETKPDQELPPRDQVETKVQRLIRERENLGAVNLRAEAEATELEQQIEGMQNERADLVAAIARLRQGISSLNREGRERLLAAFEQVNTKFGDLFTRMFGGGTAHLKLTESEDPLDAGLEIMASPPGKRLQVLSLLSGGEQALTALSLLFAVFLVNPAPICVLDEVDAPLDDNNVERFISLVDELAQELDTRFLVVTHHRLTMARVDRLFGVTMSERGVSQLVSVDLEAAEALREAG